MVVNASQIGCNCGGRTSCECGSDGLWLDVGRIGHSLKCGSEGRKCRLNGLNVGRTGHKFKCGSDGHNVGWIAGYGSKRLIGWIVRVKNGAWTGQKWCLDGSKMLLGRVENVAWTGRKCCLAGS